MLTGYPSSYSSSPRHYDHDSGPPVFLPPYQPGTPEEEEELALLRRLEREGRRWAGGEPLSGQPQAEGLPPPRSQEDEAEYLPQLAEEEQEDWPAGGEGPDNEPSALGGEWLPQARASTMNEAEGGETQGQTTSWFRPSLLANLETAADDEPAAATAPPQTGAGGQPQRGFRAVSHGPPDSGKDALAGYDQAVSLPQQGQPSAFSAAGLAERAGFRPVSTHARPLSSRAPRSGRFREPLPPLGQQPPAPAPKDAPVPAPPPRQPAGPTDQTLPASDSSKAPVAAHEVEASKTDVEVVNGVYNLSPTARLVYHEALKLGYKTQFMEPGSVGRMNKDPNARATYVKEAKTIYVDTIKVRDFGHGTAVFHEAFHIIQEQYRRDPSKLSAEARKLIENVRYKADYDVGVTPSELEARRVQNIILQEVGKKVHRWFPPLKEYDGRLLPAESETGRGGIHWSPKDDVPNDTPPIPRNTKKAGEAGN